MNTGIGFINGEDYMGKSVKGKDVILIDNLISSGKTLQ
jgi:hypoxanthine-guanine phosphoribosyltransferase